MIISSFEEIGKFKPKDFVKFKCDFCDKDFERTKSSYLKSIAPSRGSGDGTRFCSRTCSNLSKDTKIKCECLQCEKEYYALPNKTKFCSQSCAATYNNAHKTHGYRRSKLEIWLEQKLNERYAYYKIEFNKKSAINSELDIHFPDLKVAFELNGIFHYEPIYGEDKLESIKNNDHRKFSACAEKGISLCIIDTSKQDRFTEASSEKFLTIITMITDKIIFENPTLGKYDTIQNITQPEGVKIKKSRSRPKISWPNDDDLASILKRITMSQFSKENGVSVAAVSTHCKKRGLKIKNCKR